MGVKGQYTFTPELHLITEISNTLRKSQVSKARIELNDPGESERGLPVI